MNRVIKRNDDRFVVVEEIITGSGTSYQAYCNHGTGRCGGYSLSAVADMASDYSTAKGAKKAYLKKDEFAEIESGYQSL